MMKYCEILGIDVLIGLIGQVKMSASGIHNSKQISYYQKVKIIDFIIKHEAELGCQESSWRNCMMWLAIMGAIPEGERF